ncbi:MAG: aromatic acid exporter family protein [Turicibacter sp.]|nr:aromatic acid exporter family protein [Turicibacter sp.]
MNHRISKTLGLGQEAYLFDSPLYLTKSLLAIATGYIIGRQFPIANLDMISVLLGVMYNLEPLNRLGIRSAISQVLASVIGAAATGVLVLAFGVNVFSVSVGMLLTLYVCLKINWRLVSPVAIFTSIYMTQYLQLNEAGLPSIWLTFRLRIMALSLGILIALFYNYIFSNLYYKKFAEKRLQYANEQVLSGLKYTTQVFQRVLPRGKRGYIQLFSQQMNDLDLIYSNIESLKTEFTFLKKENKLSELKMLQDIAELYRDINHLTYDLNFLLESTPDVKLDKELELSLEEVIVVLESIDYTNSIVPPLHELKVEKHYLDLEDSFAERINKICEKVNLVVEKLQDL